MEQNKVQIALNAASTHNEIEMFCSGKETRAISDQDFIQKNQSQSIVVKYKELKDTEGSETDGADKNQKKKPKKITQKYTIKEIDLNRKLDDKILDQVIIDDDLAKKLIIQEYQQN